jgi:hypothetical protein
MDYNRTYEPSYNFLHFCILIDAHAVQYGINFDNNIEIHLETSTVQPIRSILHIKNNLVHII